MPKPDALRSTAKFSVASLEFRLLPPIPRPEDNCNSLVSPQVRYGPKLHTHLATPASSPYPSFQDCSKKRKKKKGNDLGSPKIMSKKEELIL